MFVASDNRAHGESLPTQNSNSMFESLPWTAFYFRSPFGRQLPHRKGPKRTLNDPPELARLAAEVRHKRFALMLSEHILSYSTKKKLRNPKKDLSLTVTGGRHMS